MDAPAVRHGLRGLHMIDIHSHILYDIEGDDGSRSLEMSLGMLRQAVDSGVTDIIATPHMHRRGVVPSWSSIQERVGTLQQEADKAGIHIHIYAGAEVSFDADTLNYLPKDGTDYCLAGTHYILIELLPTSAPENTERLIYELQLRGYLPILAHPERYKHIMEKPEYLLHWIEKGLLTQSNIGSFSGQFREKTENYVKWLYEHKAIHLLGSDAHRTDWRNADTREFQKKLQEYTGSEDFLNECSQHGEMIIKNRIFYPDAPIFKVAHKKKSFWSKLFGG